MSLPVNAKGKPFSWSYSNLDDYEGCPRRYALTKFYCTHTRTEDVALRWGNAVHKCAEQHINGDKVSSPENTLHLHPFLPIIMKARVDYRQAELEIATTKDLGITTWFAKDAWFRCKIDVIMTKKFKGLIYDWKTGKVHDKPDQLRISAAAASLVFPGINIWTPKYLWVKDKVITGCGDIDRSEISRIWDDVLRRVEVMETAWREDAFPARKSGLCRWCVDYHGCPNAKR